MMRAPFVPYFQTTRYRVEAMITLAHIKKGEKAVDLGSGDGRIVIALAQAGAEAHGYELDKELYTNSLSAIQQAHITNAFVHNTNFWDVDLSVFDIITIYPMPDIMSSLEIKCKKELKPGTRILLNYYSFENWKETDKKDNIWLYKK